MLYLTKTSLEILNAANKLGYVHKHYNSIGTRHMEHLIREGYLTERVLWEGLVWEVDELMRRLYGDGRYIIMPVVVLTEKGKQYLASRNPAST